MRREAVDALKELIAAVDGEEPVGEYGHRLLDVLTDWKEFWETDHTQEQWMAWPIIPLHRQTAIFAKGGDGKSLLIFDVVLSLVTGRTILGQPNPNGPRHVLYVDYEMTTSDLQERLEDMGFGPSDDLSYLHYAQLPPLDPLDSPAGAQQIRELAAAVEAELVVIDTFARAVQGDENESDTIRDFYRLTGSVLKADGRTLVRLDHAGKDKERGQRGTSAKNDDVDLVWHLVKNETGRTLSRKKTRVGWVPETVEITVTDDPVRHTVGFRGYIQGTSEARKDLEALGVPVEASTRQAQRALKEAGKAHRRVAVVDACRARRDAEGLGALINQHQRVVPAAPEPPLADPLTAQNGNHHKSSPVTSENHRGNHQEPPNESEGVWGSLSQREPPHGPAPEPIEDLISAFFEEDS